MHDGRQFIVLVRGSVNSSSQGTKENDNACEVNDFVDDRVHEIVVLSRSVNAGHRAEEFLRIRVLRFVKDFFCFSVFDDFAGIHDRNVVGDVAHHGEIVRDEDHGEVQLVAQLEEQIEDLGLNGNVERGYGLVSDNEFRFRGQGARDGDPLALSAGKFVRIFSHVTGVQSHRFHEFGHARGHFLFIGSESGMTAGNGFG